eukprot:1815616-Lingulodinium_polyedra.AAC.1
MPWTKASWKMAPVHTARSPPSSSKSCMLSATKYGLSVDQSGLDSWKGKVMSAQSSYCSAMKCSVASL